MNEQINMIKNFKILGEPVACDKCEYGHINRTFIVTCALDGGCEIKYVLQRINISIFRKPVELMENVRKVTEFLRAKIRAAGGDENRETMRIIETTDGKDFYIDEDGEYWRVYDFITDSVSYQSVERPILFYNSAVAFGNFQKLLADFPADQLHETILNFHNTESRLNDFKNAVAANISKRADQAADEIKFVLDRTDKCSYITSRIKSGELPLRVTHNDTKLNNIMIDAKTDEGVCVIDLDTVMPGSVLYDFGDAIRFGASSAAEDERDLDKVFVKLDLFEEFAKGFIKGLGGSLTEAEILALPMGAYVITFETGIRFLGDFINGDTYFATHRENQNLDRARTQLKLVADMESKMDEMNAIVRKYL
jgi:Phosphotransferase enzyme family.